MKKQRIKRPNSNPTQTGKEKASQRCGEKSTRIDRGTKHRQNHGRLEPRDQRTSSAANTGPNRQSDCVKGPPDTGPNWARLGRADNSGSPPPPLCLSWLGHVIVDIVGERKREEMIKIKK